MVYYLRIKIVMYWHSNVYLTHFDSVLLNGEDISIVVRAPSAYTTITRNEKSKISYRLVIVKHYLRCKRMHYAGEIAQYKARLFAPSVKKIFLIEVYF